jgi:hypothetical protein
MHYIKTNIYSSGDKIGSTIVIISKIIFSRDKRKNEYISGNYFF